MTTATRTRLTGLQRELRRERVLDALRRGEPRAEIARACGVHFSTVERIASQSGFGSSRRRQQNPRGTRRTYDRHGRSKTGAYKSWCAMMARCTSPTSTSFHYYGEAGITVDERWHHFEAFYADMGDRPAGATLERIDRTKGYCKENCRWATWREQGRNRRNNRLVTAFGETKCLSAWLEDPRCVIRTGKAITRRLDQGWTPEQAMASPWKQKLSVEVISH